MNIKQLIKQLIPIQKNKKPFVTVREAAKAWEVGVGTAFLLLRKAVEVGLVEMVNNHYHIKEGE